MALTDSGQEIRRLFVDSGPKWRVSGRNSAFVYEIPGTSLTCHKGCEFCVDSVVVGHAFFPINNSNNVVRIRIRSSASLPVQFTDHKVLLDEGGPTFPSVAQELTTKLSGLTSSTISVSWNPTTFRFVFQQSGANTFGFHILSDEELKTVPFSDDGGTAQIVANPKSANKILGIVSASDPLVGSDAYGYSINATHGVAVLLRVHSLRIVCQRLGQNTLSERGSYGTIAKLPLTEGFGELEAARESGSVDHLWMPVEGTLKRLFFEVQDEHGTELSLPDSCPISFTIAFRMLE